MSLESFETSVEMVRSEAQEVSKQYGSLLAGIDGNTKLSAEGKAEEKEALYAEFRPRMDELRDREKAHIDLAISNRLVAIEAPTGGLSTSEMPSFRDAQDRAERVESKEEALALIERALRHGDKHLAHALLRIAVDKGYSNVIDAFEKAKPGMKETIDELTQLKRFRAENQQGLQHAFIYGMGVQRP